MWWIGERWNLYILVFCWLCFCRLCSLSLYSPPHVHTPTTNTTIIISILCLLFIFSFFVFVFVNDTSYIVNGFRRLSPEISLEIKERDLVDIFIFARLFPFLMFYPFFWLAYYAPGTTLYSMTCQTNLAYSGSSSQVRSFFHFMMIYQILIYHFFIVIYKLYTTTADKCQLFHLDTCHNH